jgi:hypothetical protein
VLALWQAHIPLLTHQPLLRDYQPHLQVPGSERGKAGGHRGHSARVGRDVWGGRSEVTHRRGHCCFQPILGHVGGRGFVSWGRCLVMGKTESCPGTRAVLAGGQGLSFSWTPWRGFLLWDWGPIPEAF